MLDGLLKFISNIRNFFVEKEVAEELALDKDEIVKMVRLQLAKGIDGDGLPVYLKRHGGIFYYYAPSTKRKKDIFGVGLGSVTDPITNYMTGGFYRSIYVDVNKDATFEVKSTSYLYDLIKFRSGENIINLNPESEEYLIWNKVAPDFQEEINKLYFSEV